MITIGKHKLEGNLFLAPMAGVTDKPFRSLCRHFGANLAVSEMVTSDSRLWNSRKSQTRLPHHQEMAPRSIQIAGGDPEMMADAARKNAKLGAQIIDINMGCPAKKVCNKAAGSALLRDETLVKEILQSVVSTVDIPVTLKIRTGWAKVDRNAIKIAHIAEEAGIAALAIHGRTKKDAYTGHAEYETIRQVKQCSGLPIIANGDIESPEKAAFVLNYTKADGLMIGRGAQGQPWFFNQIHQHLKKGEHKQPDFNDRLRVILKHIADIHTFYGEDMGVRIARKHIGWYLDRLTTEKQSRKRIFAIKSPQLQLLELEKVLQDIIENI